MPANFELRLSQGWLAMNYFVSGIMSAPLNLWQDIDILWSTIRCCCYEYTVRAILL
jgi:hypothetical protein|eukprot:COSAG02_NODE_21_length_53083_cov_95.733618_39_plen_56_part_00